MSGTGQLGVLIQTFPISFNASARCLIEDNVETSWGTKTELSIGEYLKSEGYSNEFINDYLIVSLKVNARITVW
jgi:hypothetical protein